jgi:hypothetical protein
MDKFIPKACIDLGIEDAFQPVDDDLVAIGVAKLLMVYPDSTIVRKTACHGAILGFVIGA